MKQVTWLVVANGSEARIFEVMTRETFSEIESFVNEDSRKLGSDLTSDRPGRTTDKFGDGRHAMEETTPPKEAEMQRFALHLARYLDDARKQHQYHRLYLTAGPHFLGLLQNALSKHVTDLIVESVSKDLTSIDPSQLGKRLTIRMPL